MGSAETTTVPLNPSTKPPIGTPTIHGRVRDIFRPIRLGLMLAMVLSCTVEASEPLPPPRYSLFDPVPRQAMRPLSTDRPDQTESAYSVDAGHVQFEFEVAKATFGTVSADGDRSGRELVLGGVNAKVGLIGIKCLAPRAPSR